MHVHARARYVNLGDLDPPKPPLRGVLEHIFSDNVDPIHIPTPLARPRAKWGGSEVVVVGDRGGGRYDHQGDTATTTCLYTIVYSI